MALYKLPLGIRIPRNDEYPNGNDVKSINDKRNSANIIQGFMIKEVTGQKFSHYVEANVDVDKILDVFCALTKKLFDNVAYGILGFKDDEQKLSGFTKAQRFVEIFGKYNVELVNDGYLEFGIANYDENSLNEIFVTSFKYMKLWTTKKELIIETLNSFGIQEVENLQFIDEFPIVSEALSDKMVKGVNHYSEVMLCIEREFENI